MSNPAYEHEYSVRKSRVEDWEQTKLAALESKHINPQDILYIRRRWDIASQNDFGEILILEKHDKIQSNVEISGFLIIHYRYKALVIVEMGLRKIYPITHYKYLLDYIMNQYKNSTYELVHTSIKQKHSDLQNFLISYGFFVAGYIDSYTELGVTEIQFLYPLRTQDAAQLKRTSPYKLISD